MSVAFAAPAFLWLLLALPLVVVLHFLRARTRRVDVSALFLWEQARSVAERRRRFSPSWSLLLQLLAVAAGALALAQPDLRRGGPPDLVVVIDASASMAATEPEGARLERAREATLRLAQSAGRVALVRAGLEPSVALAFSDDRGELGAALDALVVGDRGADLDRAVALALDLAAAGDQPARVALISDDPGPQRAGVTRVDVGGSGVNVGIVAFDVGIQQAFVAVASNAVGPRSVGVELRRDGALLASTDLLVPSGDVAGVTFPIDVEPGVIEARLVGLAANDALALDDVAYAGQRPLEVLLDADVESVRRALGAVPGVASRVTGLARTAPADVRVLTGVDPDDAPPGDVILLPDPLSEPSFVTIASWDRTEPLLRFVDLREVVVGLPAAGAMQASLDDPGWTVLASTADLRPVLRWREDERGRVLQFLFHPRQTDLVFRPAFPTLIANALERFRGDARVPLGTVGDDGRPVVTPGPTVVHGRTVSANLLDASQTRLPGQGPSDLDEAGGLLTVERPTPLAAWLLVLALVALLLEWWLWSRGSGATMPRPRWRRGRPRPV